MSLGLERFVNGLDVVVLESGGLIERKKKDGRLGVSDGEKLDGWLVLCLLESVEEDRSPVKMRI